MRTLLLFQISSGLWTSSVTSGWTVGRTSSVAVSEALTSVDIRILLILFVGVIRQGVGETPQWMITGSLLEESDKRDNIMKRNKMQRNQLKTLLFLFYIP